MKILRVMFTDVVARSGIHGPLYYDAPVVLNSVICSGIESSIKECRLSGFNTVFICTAIATVQCESESMNIL